MKSSETWHTEVSSGSLQFEFHLLKSLFVLRELHLFCSLFGFFFLIFSEAVQEILILYQTSYGWNDLCLRKLMLRSNVPGNGQNELAVCVRDSIICNGCSRDFMNNWFGTNWIISNKIIVFLFHIVIKKQTSSPFYKNEELKTINMYFIDVWFIFESLSGCGPRWVRKPDYIWLVLEPRFSLFTGNIHFYSSSQLLFRSLEGKNTNCRLFSPSGYNKQTLKKFIRPANLI